MRLIKTVFHVHSDWSVDSNTSPESLIDEAGAAGVHCVVVTDHDTIEGARRVAHVARDCDLRVVVGEEISTADGHLIGLFLHQPVEPGQPVRRTAELIGRQGGLVVVPHPFNRIYNCGLRDKVNDLLDLIDIVEVYNAQNALPLHNMLARRFAERHGYAVLVGADAHMPSGLAPCYQWMPPFEGPRQFLQSVRQAWLVPGRHSAGYFLHAAYRLALHRLGLPPPRHFGRNYSPHQAGWLEPAPTSP